MNRYKKILAFIGLIILTISCSKDNIEYSENLEYGSVVFSCQTQSSVLESTRSSAIYTIPDYLIPEVDSLIIEISGSYLSSEQEQEFSFGPSTIYEYNTEPPIMVASEDYSAQIYFGQEEIEGDSAAYFGASVNFEVVARGSTTEEVKVYLQNSIISIEADEIFSNYYSDAVFTVTTQAENSFEFSLPSQRIVFVNAESILTLSGTATRNGQTTTFSPAEIGITSPKTMSYIEITASSVGGQSINITLDQTVTEMEPTIIELNPQ